MAWVRHTDGAVRDSFARSVSRGLVYRSRRFFGAGVEIISTGIGTGRGQSTLIQVHDPITVASHDLKNIHRVSVLLLREALHQLGFCGVRDLEIQVIAGINPQVSLPTRAKLKNHTVLMRVDTSGAAPSEARHLDSTYIVVFATKGEGVFTRALKRIRKARVKRAVKRRNLIRKGAVK